MDVKIQTEHRWNWDEKYYRIVDRSMGDAIGYVGERPKESWYYEKTGGREMVEVGGLTSRRAAVDALIRDVKGEEAWQS